MADDAQTKEQQELEEKKKQAMLAMEGPEGRAHRETLERKEHEEEIKKRLGDERQALQKKIEELSTGKERLELKWVELNETKAPLEKSLAPVVAEETKVEKEESDIEMKERSTSDPVEKQATEKMRWGADDRRRAIEKERWSIEDEIGKINDIIKTNSEKYQELLAEEEKSQRRLDEIIKELAVYGG